MEENKAPEAKPANSDVEKNKVMAVLAYFIFFIPLLAAKDSKFAMYHANQGLLVLITSLVVNFVLGMIPLIGWFLIIPFGNIVVLILAIMGIINAANGQMKPLPVIGKYTILK